MTSTLSIEYSDAIRQPIEIVSRQFGDVQHHGKNRVHPDLTFTILSDQNGVCHFKQEVTLMRMKQVDEIIQKRLADGSLDSEVIAGTNLGMRIRQSFSPIEGNATAVRLQIDTPVSGIKRLLKPLFKAAVLSTVRKAFAEDRIDLEERGYPRA
jgi:hypothetical protein